MEGQTFPTTTESEEIRTIMIDAFPGGASQDGMSFIFVLGSCTCWLSNIASVFLSFHGAGINGGVKAVPDAGAENGGVKGSFLGQDGWMEAVG